MKWFRAAILVCLFLGCSLLPTVSTPSEEFTSFEYDHNMLCPYLYGFC